MAIKDSQNPTLVNQEISAFSFPSLTPLYLCFFLSVDFSCFLFFGPFKISKLVFNVPDLFSCMHMNGLLLSSYKNVSVLFSSESIIFRALFVLFLATASLHVSMDLVRSLSCELLRSRSPLSF